MSGELCGIFAFLIFAVVWQRPVSVRSILGLVAALFLYGGSMLFSLINLSGDSPRHSGWEQKVFGFITGIAWALVFFK
jgi:membrane associated rhomboid family serine protease